jgi:hypothetical protein
MSSTIASIQVVVTFLTNRPAASHFFLMKCDYMHSSGLHSKPCISSLHVSASPTNPLETIYLSAAVFLDLEMIYIIAVRMKKVEVAFVQVWCVWFMKSLYV